MSLQNRHFISTIELINKFIQTLSETNYDANLWTKTYLDPTTGDQWLQYYVDGELHGGGYPILARIPLPDTMQLIEIAIATDTDDELFGVCRTLIEKEKTNKTNFRIHLIERLEKLDDKKKVKRIIELTNLDSGLNRHPILGKTVHQINEDANYFQNIAKRADNLK
jgi:hypothetical protein